jgi:UDP-glucose 4-epimerase
MKVLITGGAGFIGSHLTDRLLNRKDEVLVIDNYETGRRDNLRPHRNLQIVEDTICNEKEMHKLMLSFKPELVIHAAASYKNPENWVEDSRTNVTGSAIICQAHAPSTELIESYTFKLPSAMAYTLLSNL